MSALPKPNAQQMQRSEALKKLILQRLKKSADALANDSVLDANKHLLPFHDFMEMVLYSKDLGYYSALDMGFAEQGDFTTAPELSPLFSHCLAKQVIEIKDNLGSGAFDVLELGAGSGKMALAILTYLQQQEALPQHYYIYEKSLSLREKQQTLLKTNLPDYYQQIVWLDEFAGIEFSGVVLANEVLDALPVNLFKYHNKKTYNAYVGYDETEDKFYFDYQLTADDYVESLNQYYKLNDNYQSEYYPGLLGYISQLSNLLKRGVMLFVDYGYPGHEYYHPDRHMGTLMCHYAHHTHPDPLIYLGLQDVTTHVDFTRLACVASELDLGVAGFTNQASFLLSLGLLEMANNAETAEQQLQMSNVINKLTAPHEMGELFKVMALSKNYDAELLGFSLQDQRHRL